MFDSQDASSGLSGRHGSRPIALAELRRRLARPSDLQDGHQQRLLELAQRLTRVRALGSNYGQVELSNFVTHAMDRGVVTV